MYEIGEGFGEFIEPEIRKPNSTLRITNRLKQRKNCRFVSSDRHLNVSSIEFPPIENYNFHYKMRKSGITIVNDAWRRNILC